MSTLNIIPQSFSFSGPRIVESELVTEQFRFPRTKKRRIRNKWAKRPENHRPRRGVLHDTANNVMYVHPQYLAVLQQSLAADISRGIDERVVAGLRDDADDARPYACERCAGDGWIDYNDGDGSDWGEDCPSEENHPIICRVCRGTGVVT